MLKYLKDICESLFMYFIIILSNILETLSDVWSDMFGDSDDDDVDNESDSDVGPENCKKNKTLFSLSSDSVSESAKSQDSSE